jgi:phosphohistidine phosphatase
MKRLTLVRHAHAKVKDAVTDFERPLSRRGKNEAKDTARALLEQGLVPDLLITSAAKRTAQTADIFARELKLPARRVRQDELLYLANADTLLTAIQATGPRIEHLMLVGHNPGISVLANAFAPAAELGEFATAAACTLEFDARTWPAIDVGAAKNAKRNTRPSFLFGFFE